MFLLQFSHHWLCQNWFVNDEATSILEIDTSVNLCLPIFFSHYYIVVIPHSNESNINFPDQFHTAELTANSKSGRDGGGGGKGQVDHLPYIAAKFLQRSIPYTFVLGDGQNYEGFVNYKLKPGVYYKIFVRAYVDIPQKHLFTSSPFSPQLSSIRKCYSASLPFFLLPSFPISASLPSSSKILPVHMMQIAPSALLGI